ncbi:MAG: glycoside hydrolase family 5 protein [Clostridiales bacterium]|nr:glycoside hydrolase family 5 protein [Clostridiales bacterium]
MKYVICTILSAMLLLPTVFPMLASAEEMMTGLTAAEIVAQMGLGWNLGNTFDATGGNTADVYSQEQSWGNPRVDAALIKRVKAAGFKTIRIPVTWQRHLSKDGSYTINPAFLARVKEVVDMAYDEGLFVIINLHHEAWVNDRNLDTKYEQIGVQLSAVWRQLADAFADYDQHLIFEGMNEPRMQGSAAEWNGTKEGIAAVNYLNQVFVNTIRTDAKGYNAERALMIPGYAASSSSAVMAAIQLPQWNGATAENIIVSVHCYTPYDFCLSDAMTNFNRLYTSHTTPIDMIYYSLKGLFLSKGIPVVMGESSATFKDNDPARAQWAYYMGMKAATYGIPICIWDNGHNGNSGGECHAWINRRNDTPIHQEVLEALFEGAASVEWGYANK